MSFLKRYVGDLYGGITAAVVALPLGLAFGIASGAGPIAGIYGAIFVGFGAALFGGTAVQISGPTGPMTVVITAIIADFMARYPDAGLAMAFTVVMGAGLIQILMGSLKLGKYMTQVPHTVVSGFMTGIGVIIIILQLPVLLGHESKGSIVEVVGSLPPMFLAPDWPTLVIGGLALGASIFWPKSWRSILPAPLLALFVGIGALFVFGNPESLSRVGVIPFGIPEIVMPTLEFDILKDILSGAILLALLGSLDSLLTSLVADKMTKTRHNPNKELIGQGIGNTVAGIFGALPGAGATMRTVVNINAGGQTRLSGIIHSVTILLVVLTFGELGTFVPQAALAGILIKVGLDVMDWDFIKKANQVPKSNLCLMLLVLGCTIFVDLITAVLVGIFIANIVTIEKLSGLELDRVDINDGNSADQLPILAKEIMKPLGDKALYVGINGTMTYGSVRDLRFQLTQYDRHESLIFNLSDAQLIGLTATLTVAEILHEQQSKGRKVYVVSQEQHVVHKIQALGPKMKADDMTLLSALEELRPKFGGDQPSDQEEIYSELPDPLLTHAAPKAIRDAVNSQTT